MFSLGWSHTDYDEAIHLLPDLDSVLGKAKVGEGAWRTCARTRNLQKHLQYLLYAPAYQHFAN